MDEATISELTNWESLQLMMECREVLNYLEEFAPLQTAESWDNVGLLLGSRDVPVSRIMTCLTLTPDVADEAIRRQISLIVTHHPLLFRAVQKITTDTAEGTMLLKLIEHQVSVYSPHTAFDNALAGINQQWCERLGLQDVQPLRPYEKISSENSSAGSGRQGTLPRPISLSEFIEQLKQLMQIPRIQFVGEGQQMISRVAVACGAAGEYLGDAHRSGCDLFITGETRFHGCLEARALGTALILVGHYQSERFACEQLAENLKGKFPQLSVHASEVESDPLNWS